MYLRYLNVFECFSLKISAQRIWEVTNVQKNGSSVCNESRLTLKERKKKNETREEMYAALKFSSSSSSSRSRERFFALERQIREQAAEITRLKSSLDAAHGRIAVLEASMEEDVGLLH